MVSTHDRLADLTAEDFIAVKNTSFRVVAVDSAGRELSTQFVLDGVTCLAGGPEGRAVPFSLIFSGPVDLIMEQGTYSMNHVTLGELEIFIVPVGANEESRTYQAIFS